MILGVFWIDVVGSPAPYSEAPIVVSYAWIVFFFLILT